MAIEINFPSQPLQMTHNDYRGLFLKRWTKGESLRVLQGSEMNSRL